MNLKQLSALSAAVFTAISLYGCSSVKNYPSIDGYSFYEDYKNEENDIKYTVFKYKQNNNSENVLFIAQLQIDSGEIQQIKYQPPQEALYLPAPDELISIKDINNDQNYDILLYRGSFGNQGVRSYDAYLQNNQTMQFEFLDGFSDIPNPQFDSNKPYILSSFRDNADTYIYETYEINDGQVQTDRRLIVKYLTSETAQFKEYVQNDGRLELLKEIAGDSVFGYYSNDGYWDLCGEVWF